MTVALQSRDHRNLLDIIDRLRSKGISRYVDLPQIVVCGDQSAGKSSVLEAISGMSFPSKDNLCTRFATELILRRHDSQAIKVSIIPGPDCSSEDRERLSDFSADIDIDAPDIGSVVEKAKEVMGLSETKVFSTDVLRVELCGPTQPHLTMVDLPGLFRAGNRDQSVDDAETVRNLVLGYVRSPRSIILAVVSAKSDFALQEITQMAREVDPEGNRTLGLITKPDALDVGSDSEASYVKLAQNNDVVFRLGWHALKNRDFKMRDASSAERDAAEARFFSSGIWATLDPSNLGVGTLKPRLSDVLKNQILQQLPDLLHDVEFEIDACSSIMKRLGTPRSSANEQRKYLLKVSREFTSLMKAAINGEYNHPFFGSAKTDEGYNKRLRARVQNTLADFKEAMRERGEQRKIVDEDSSESVLGYGARKVMRSDYIGEVQQLMERSRGCELSGTFNPLIVGELFADQCQPWKNLASETEKRVLQAVDEVEHEIVDYITIKETAPAILQMLRGGTDMLKKALGEKLKELLQPHSDGHPITYNDYLTDTVKRAQDERRKRRLETEVSHLVRHDFFVASSGTGRIDVGSIVDKLNEKMDSDMDSFASEMAIDYMEAYYEVAINKFIDDVSVLAVEQCLISKLPDLFPDDILFDFKDEDIARLAGETEAASKQREKCNQKLALLEDGRRDLMNLAMKGSLDSDDGDVISSAFGANERRGENVGSDEMPLSSPSTGPNIKAGDGCSESSEASAAEEVPGKEETPWHPPMTFADMFDPETPVPGSEKMKTDKKTKKGKKRSKLGKGAASKPKKESIW
ncbi:hypothetical protein E4U60_000485 [Claviceps pazoutovae]|uniref:Interferon-induced GTP-binding protein Mx n=1 Tax=Claviceps pazoutovae TaxID=1649127 RepID=A0A9P7MEG5_9HYPO|nr:hypothetical protein E4U60_000485 [Claviceps pazoutovae]